MLDYSKDWIKLITTFKLQVYLCKFSKDIKLVDLWTIDLFEMKTLLTMVPLSIDKFELFIKAVSPRSIDNCSLISSQSVKVLDGGFKNEIIEIKELQ